MTEFQYSSFADMMWMSGHGPYVWASYAIVVVALGLLIWMPIREKKAFLKTQKGILARQQESKES